MRQISDRLLMRVTMIFIYLPVAIWLFTWCGLWIAVPAAAAVTYGLHIFTRDMTGRTEYSLPVLILFCVAFSAVLVKGGHLAVFTQHSDWYKSNAVMTDMAERSWPVTYENGGESAMLTYYTGIYIVPALAGKVFGTDACRYVLFAETVLTGLLLYLNLCRCLGVKSTAQSAVIAACLLMFNLPMALLSAVQAMMIRLDIPSASNMAVNSTYLVLWEGSIYGQDFEPLTEGYSYTMEHIGDAGFRGSYTGITAFLPYYMTVLITAVWHRSRENTGSYAFIWAPMALYCALAVPYIFVLVVAEFICRLAGPGKKLPAVAGNVIGAVPVVPLAAYYAGYLLGDKEGSENTLMLSPVLPMALLMFAVCVLPVIIMAYRENKGDRTYWMAGALMLLSCVPAYGRFNDLMITGTVPLMALLLIFTANTLVRGLDGGLKQYGGKRSATARKIALALLLLTGTLYATGLHKTESLSELADSFADDLRDGEVIYTYSDFTATYGIDVKDSIYKDIEYQFIINETGYTYGTMAVFADRGAKCENDLKYNYFTYDYRDSLFWKAFARK